MLAQHGAHVFKSEAEAVQLRGIDINAHCRQGAAADVHLAHAVDLQQALLHDRGGGVVKLAAIVNIGRERKDHDRRVGGIDLSIGWFARQVRRQIGSRGVDRSLNVTRRAVDTSVQIKLQCDAGGAQITGGGHFGDAGDMAELPFQRRGDR